MRIFNRALALCAASLVFVQCADRESENYSVREQAVFDHWMQTNHGRTGVERMDNGMYMEWLRRGTGNKLAKDNYMYVDYRGYTLDGDIFSNRDSLTAVRQGTFTRYTHYADHYALYNESAYYFTKGEYDALAQMKEGDSVRLYLPSKLAYVTASGTSFSLGYEGWYNSSTNPKNSAGSPYMSGRPVVIELALNGVVSDAKARELNDATAAKNALGTFTSDTTGLFFRYVELENPQPGDVSGEDAEAGLIKGDSTFYFVYALRFLDDFLIATNDKATAYQDWGDFWTTYKPIKYSKSSSLLENSTSGLYISALNELMKREKMRYNSRMQVVFTSDFGYGYYGNPATATRPAVYPYTPLKMDIITLKHGYDPNKEGKDE